MTFRAIGPRLRDPSVTELVCGEGHMHMHVYEVVHTRMSFHVEAGSPC